VGLGRVGASHSQLAVNALQVARIYQLGLGVSVKLDIADIVHGMEHELYRAERTRACSRDGGAESDPLTDSESY